MIQPWVNWDDRWLVDWHDEVKRRELKLGHDLVYGYVGELCAKQRIPNVATNVVIRRWNAALRGFGNMQELGEVSTAITDEEAAFVVYHLLVADAVPISESRPPPWESLENT